MREIRPEETERQTASTIRDWVRLKTDQPLRSDKLQELDLSLPPELAKFLVALLGDLDCEIVDSALGSEYSDVQIPMSLLRHSEGEAYLFHVEAAVLRQPDKTLSQAMFAMVKETNLLPLLTFIFSPTVHALAPSWERYFEKEWKKAKDIDVKLVPWETVITLEDGLRKDAAAVQSDAKFVFRLEDDYWANATKEVAAVKHSSLEEDELVVLADCLEAQASVLGTEGYVERLDAAVESLKMPQQWLGAAKSALKKETNAARGIIDVLASKGSYQPTGSGKLTPLGALIIWLVEEMGGSEKAESLADIAEKHNLVDDNELDGLRDAAAP